MQIADLIRLMIQDRKNFLTAQFLALLATLAAIPTPLLMPILVDEVLLGRDGIWKRWLHTLFGFESAFGYVIMTLLVVLGLRFLYTYLQILQSKLFHTISKSITASIRKRVLMHLQKVSLSEFEILGSGSVAAKLINDVETIDAFLSNSVAKFLISVLMLVGVSVILLLIHWQLALFILILNPFVVLFSTKLARKVAKLKKEQNKVVEIFSQTLVETLDLFEQIRAYNKERFFFAKLIDLVNRLRQKSIDFSYKSDAGVKISFLIFVAGFELFRAAGIIAVAYSDLSIGLMMAIFAYLWFMMTPIQDLINIQYSLKNAQAALDRINQLFNLAQEPHYPHLFNPFTKKPVSIELKNINFRYEDEPVLKGVDLRIDGGKITAIVGASGSGKTTLCRLMVGFYPLQDGDILYNGISIKSIGLEVVRSRVALVLQQSPLFNDTIRFNLTLGEEINEERLWEALRLASIDDVVRKMPQKLDTVVGRGGVKLSGGERQRIHIARMILKNPDVIILDEATSAVDVETEREIFHNLQAFFQERTLILIAHRASTIEKADFIYVLQDGKVKEEMNFKEYKEKFS